MHQLKEYMNKLIKIFAEHKKSILFGVLYIMLLLQPFFVTYITVINIVFVFITVKYIYLGIKQKNYLFYWLVFTIFMITSEFIFRIQDNKIPLLFLICLAISVYVIIIYVIIKIILLLFKNKSKKLYKFILLFRVLVCIFTVDFMIQAVILSSSSYSGFNFKYKQYLIYLVTIYYIWEYLLDIANIWIKKKE